jgi:hypothetical protein
VRRGKRGQKFEGADAPSMKCRTKNKWEFLFFYKDEVETCHKNRGSQLANRNINTFMFCSENQFVKEDTKTNKSKENSKMKPACFFG